MGYFDLSGSQASPPPPQKWNIAKKKINRFSEDFEQKKIWYNFFFHFGLYHFFWVKKPKSSLLKIERWFLVPVGKIWFQAYTNK